MHDDEVPKNAKGEPLVSLTDIFNKGVLPNWVKADNAWREVHFLEPVINEEWPEGGFLPVADFQRKCPIGCDFGRVICQNKECSNFGRNYSV